MTAARRPPRSMSRQRGVALLSAVLVVALAVLLVASLLDTGEASRARTRNALRAEQTWQLLLGLEGWAVAALRRDEAEAAGVDGPGDAWLVPLPPIRIPGGEIRGRLRDASGCFNLNRLHAAGVDDPQALAAFERLLANLRLDPTLAQRLADWMDADAIPRSGGAEDAHYAQRQPPYRTAAGPLAHVSELRLVAGVDDAAFQRLAPHACALPVASAGNINFATRPLWMSLDPRITEAMAERLWREGRARYRSLDEVRSALRDEGVEPVDLSAWATTSRFLVLEAEVEVDGVAYAYASLIERDERGLRVRARTRGGLQ